MFLFVYSVDLILFLLWKEHQHSTFGLLKSAAKVQLFFQSAKFFGFFLKKKL